MVLPFRSVLTPSHMFCDLTSSLLYVNLVSVNNIKIFFIVIHNHVRKKKFEKKKKICSNKANDW